MSLLFGGIALLLANLHSIIWSLPFIVTYFIGIRLYHISDGRIVPMILSRISNNSSYISDNKIRGWIWGKYYIGYITKKDSSNGNSNNTDNKIIIYILCFSTFYDNITRYNYINDTNDNTNDNTNINSNNNKVDTNKSGNNKYNDLNDISKKTEIKYYERSGTYYYLEYKSRNIYMNDIIPRENQLSIIQNICDEYKKRNNVVSIIYGDPGSGKSMVSLLLVNKLNGSLCDSYNPTEPGDDIGIIYNTVMPTRSAPLILVLEEFNIIMDKIHNNLITPHKNIPIQVNNKITWNSLFDKIDRGLYPYMIVLLISNENPEYIDKLDSSYLRYGRVNSRYKL